VPGAQNAEKLAEYARQYPVRCIWGDKKTVEIIASGRAAAPLACSPVRILYVYDTPMPDTGADTEQVAHTLSALARLGHGTELLIPGPATGPGDAEAIRKFYQIRGDLTLHLLHWRFHHLRALEKWSHALRAPRHPAVVDADLVYTRNLPAAWSFLHAGRRVVYEHFRPWGDQIPPLQPILRGILRHPRLVGAIFHSQHTLESYRRLGIPEERMLVAHNGWDPGRMEPRLSRAAARTRLGLEPGRFTAVYTGRINARKGLDIVLELARQAPEMLFILVGSEGQGPIETEARALANVRVEPWQRYRDLAPWLYAADVLLIPPSLEPLERHGTTVLPIKLFLYLAAGRALVAPDAPDTAELLTDGMNAVLVPAGDVPAATAALRSLAADPSQAARLAEAALATANGLTWDARAARIAAFLSARLSAPAVELPRDLWTLAGWLRESGRWLAGGR
ncbi:MAG TPA: glycosyltransferase, partial [Gemmatimonadales bacterium]